MPERFTATIWSQPSIETSRKLRFGELMPALFTRMSTRPWRLEISAAALATWSFCATSHTTDSALTCFSASLSVVSVRPERMTVAPSFCNSTAPARPIPEPPPVIQATFPERSPLISPLGILRRAEENLALLVRVRSLAPAIGEHLHRFRYRRPRGDLVSPALDVGVVVDVHALALGRPQPRHRRHVGDGVFVASEPFALRELPVEHAVEAVGLVLVPIHRVLNLLRGVAEEVMSLAEHRSHMAHLRHHPLHHLPALLHVLRQEFSRLGREIKEHRARLGEHEGLAVRPLLVVHRRDLVVRREGEEFGLELLARADVDRMHAVLELALLEHDVDFVSVGRRPGVEVDHSFTSCFPKFLPARRSIRPRGAFSSPCTTDSLYFSRPCARRLPSSLSASP